MADIVKADIEKGDKIVKLSDIVNFKVDYPKEFKGEQYLKQGKVVKGLHRLHATRLEKKGIGKIQEIEK